MFMVKTKNELCEENIKEQSYLRYLKAFQIYY